jgi:GDP-L-fucose synthase
VTATAPFMPPGARIYVAGHRGLVGSALVRRLRGAGYRDLILRTHAELDLTDRAAVAAFFSAEQPEFVFLAAAKVGGILANDTFPADFIRVNLEIQTNTIEQARCNGVKRLLFLGSTCIYPRDCPQPIKEDYLLTGPLETTNSAYALAKIAGIEMCRSYNQQYGTKFLAAMPTNLYGPGDNYDLQGSHVLPALIRKFHEAHVSGAPEVTVWGTGRPLREFLYSDDMADACVFLMNLESARFDGFLRSQRYPLINVGFGSDISIADLARLVAEVEGYTGRIMFDTTKPDGTPRKLTDPGRLFGLGWRPGTELKHGIALARAEYLERVAASQPVA